MRLSHPLINRLEMWSRLQREVMTAIFLQPFATKSCHYRDSKLLGRVEHGTEL